MHSWQEQKSALEIFTHINARNLGCLLWKPFRDYFHASKTLKGLFFFQFQYCHPEKKGWHHRSQEIHCEAEKRENWVW